MIGKHCLSFSSAAGIFPLKSISTITTPTVSAAWSLKDGNHSSPCHSHNKDTNSCSAFCPVPCKYTAETWPMTRFIWTHEPQCMNFTWITVLIKTKWPQDQSCTYKSSCSHSWNKAAIYVPEYMRQTIHPHRRYRGHLPPGQGYLAHLWPGIPLSLAFHSTLHQQIWGTFNDSAREMLFWTPDPELDWCKPWAQSVQQSVPSWADFP